VRSDWTWDKALPKIVHDKRYRALSTLGERKQAFNSYREEAAEAEEVCVVVSHDVVLFIDFSMQNEREEALQRIRNGFKEMLAECKELTPSMHFTDAAKLLSTDEVSRFVSSPVSSPVFDRFRNCIYDHSCHQFRPCFLKMCIALWGRRGIA
jgi:pre-mRNA-processing factor 40